MSSLLKVFNDQSASDQIVQFLRLLTSAFIKNRAEFFRHFIDEEMDIKDFCTHVGPRGLKLWGLSPQPWDLLCNPQLLRLYTLGRTGQSVCGPWGSAVKAPLPSGGLNAIIPSQGTSCRICICNWKNTISKPEIDPT